MHMLSLVLTFVSYRVVDNCCILFSAILEHLEVFNFCDFALNVQTESRKSTIKLEFGLA